MTGFSRIEAGSILILSLFILGSMPSVIAVGHQTSVDLDIEDWWTNLPFGDKTSVMDTSRELALGGWIFDPLEGAAVIPDWPSKGSDGPWMVQFHGPVNMKILEEYSIVDVLSWNTLLVRERTRVIEELVGYGGVRSVTPYHPVFKIEDGLLDRIVSSNGKGDYDAVIGLYRLPLESEMDSIEGHDAVFDTRSMLLHITLSADEVQEFASEEWVSHVSSADTIGLDNDIAADIIDVQEVRNTLSLNGSGQIVAVCDTGLDTGKNSTMHSDFKGRIVAAYDYGRTGNWSDPDIHVWDSSSGSWSYKGGHGTHVAGSVLADGSSSGGKYAGMAPAAELVFQSTMKSSGSLSTPAYATFLNDAYKNGARVQTNSWSSRSSYGNYTWRSWQTDNYIWSHKNLTVLFSAGNKGSLGTYSVSTQASSKNVIAVGASENYRPTISSWANNISQMADFSSQGPTWGDNRVKPDVVAPGTYILSTRASTISDFWNHYWGSNSTYVGVNSKYAYMGGTSMSTPIVAGTAALVRQYYEDIEGHDDPSAALVKSTLINGARPLDGKWSSVPNKYEGWGRVNLSNSLATNDSDSGAMSFIDNSSGLKTGENHTRLYTLTGGGADIVITLVWTDYPGSNTSSSKLVNDLDLTITAPNGTKFKGNEFLYSSSGAYDRRNNVERIVIEDPSSGVYSVNISGYSVTKGPQPYAYVITGNLSGAVGSLSWIDDHVSANGSSAEIELSDSNLTGDGWAIIKVNSSSDPAGEQINLTEVMTGGKGIGIFRGSVKVVTTNPGPGEVQVTMDEMVTAYYDDGYPDNSISRSIMAYVPAVVHDVKHDSEGKTLTYLDEVRVMINGTSGWSAHFDVVGLGTRQDIDARDDGISPDISAGDGIYTGSFTVPNLIVGNFSIRGTIKRSYLPAVSALSSTEVVINTNLPRKPLFLSVDPVPSGNSLALDWQSPGDINLMAYLVYRADETFQGSGIPDDFSLVHTTPDNRTYYTDTGLIDGSTYFYRLRSLNVLGYRSEPTDWNSGVPSDEVAPWITTDYQVTPLRVSGIFQINYSADSDSTGVEFQGALDDDGDSYADHPWVALGVDDSPDDPFGWDTTNLPSPIVESKKILIRVRIWDESDNTNISVPLLSVIVDNTAPDTLSITSDMVKATNISVYQLTGTTEPDASIRILKNGSLFIQGTSDASGEFLIYLNLDEGENLFTIECYDLIGNGPLTFDNKILVVFDDVLPEAGIEVIDATTSSPITFDGSSSRYMGPDTVLSGLVNFTWRIETPEGILELFGMKVGVMITLPGLFKVELTVIDSALNHGRSSISFKVLDTTPPAVTQIEDMTVFEDTEITLTSPMIIDNDPGIALFGNFYWSLTGPDERTLSGYEVMWTFNTPGIYNCTYTVSDTGGNNASTSFFIHVVDTTPPSAMIGGSTQVVRGILHYFDAYLSTDNDPLFPQGANFTWQIAGEGKFHYGPRAGISFQELGEHTLRLKLTDGSGNVGHDEIDVEVVTDGQPPTIEWSNFQDDPRNLTPGSSIRIIFDEVIDLETIFNGIHLIGPSGIDVKSTTRSIDNRTIEIDPESDLEYGKEYLVLLTGALTDNTGEKIQPVELPFIIHERISIIEIHGQSGPFSGEYDLGELSLPWNLEISLKGRPGSEPVVIMTGGDGVDIETSASWDPENARLVIFLGEGISPGSYRVEIEAQDQLGRGMEDEIQILFEVVSKVGTDTSLDNGKSFSLLTGIIIVTMILIMIIIAAVFIIIRKKRVVVPENEAPPSMDQDPLEDDIGERRSKNIYDPGDFR